MIKILLILIYGGLGFSFALSPAAGFDLNILRLLIPCIFLLWLGVCASQKKIVLPSGTLPFLCTALLFWICLSLFYSAVPTWTLRKIIFLVTLLPLVFVTYHHMRQHGAVSVVRWVVRGGTLVALVGVIQFLLQFIIARDSVVAAWGKLMPFFLGGTFSESVASFNSWYVHVAGVDLFRAISFFPDPHIFAYFTGMILPFGIALAYQEKSTLNNLSIGILLLGNLFTFSRGGEIALLVGTLAFVVFFLKNYNTRLQHFFFGIVAVFLLGVIAFGSPLFERLQSSVSSTDTSVSSRFELWDTALESIVAHPFFGTGLGAYSYSINPLYDYRTPYYAHNLYLDVAAEVGVIGLLIFCAISYVMLRSFFRKSSTDIYAQAGIISIIIFGTHSLFDTPIFSVHIFILLLFLLSLSITYDQHHKTS